ncbi:MAG TPA: hypothetical protein VFI21_11945 [Nocardioides sp.]|nr:hypothetical protein [Nocardioides sp.]
MNTEATVRTEDLGHALDYLEGLQLILETLHKERRGREESDDIVDQLHALDGYYPTSWDPIRYQFGVGQGWSYVAHNVGELRARLLEGYSDAAL